VTLKYNKLKVFLNGLISISFIHFQDLRFINGMSTAIVDDTKYSAKFYLQVIWYTKRRKERTV
jgi:hypothetical protein